MNLRTVLMTEEAYTKLLNILTLPEVVLNSDALRLHVLTESCEELEVEDYDLNVLFKDILDGFVQ